MNSMQGYEKEVQKEIEKKGYKVELYENSSKIPKNDASFFIRILRSLAEDFNFEKFKKMLFNAERQYYFREFKKIDTNYDYILDIGAKSSPNFMKILREKVKGKSILFIWDDLRYDKRSEELIKEFDKTYSYCLEDSEKYKLKYRPSFYLNIFKYENEKKNIDVFYLGNMREKERTVIIKAIDESLPNLNKFIKLCGTFKLKYLTRYISYEVYKKYFIKNPLNIYELSSKYKESKVIMDITLKTQIGLGLRPLESIASKSKLITTNPNIKKYDFYNENNVFVLHKDLSNVEGLEEFIHKPYQEYSDEIKYKYSVDGFLNDIFKN